MIGCGGMPLPVDNGLVEQLRQRAATVSEQVLTAGARVRIIEGSFAELDASLMAMEGEQCVVLLLSLLNRQQRISVLLEGIVKIELHSTLAGVKVMPWKSQRNSGSSILRG